MAGDKKASSSPVVWIFVFVIVVIALWIAGGKSPGTKKLFFPPTYPIGPYPQAPAVLPQQEIKTAPETETEPEAETKTYKGEIRLNIRKAKESNPDEEYIIITASYKNKKPISISGWTLKGSRGNSATIGEGAYLVYAAQVNPQKPILLEPGAEAIVITGRSPIGTNFQLNKCIGYFNQFQEFIPSLPQKCPEPEDEVGVRELPDACIDYLKQLKRCEIPLTKPHNISPECNSFVDENINYSGCVNNHRNDPDFFEKDWRIYLNREEELWKNQYETITIYDQDGRIVAQESY